MISGATLFVSLLFTAAAWLSFSASEEGLVRERFVRRAENIATEIRSRMLDYQQVLRGCQGLFAASDRVSSQEWKTYVERLDLNTHYPGIQGIGFGAWMPDVQTTGRVPVTYLEPADTRNIRALGFDMYAERRRRAAMEFARDQNAPALTGRVILAQEIDSDIQYGTLLYLPIFRNGSPVATVIERREALVGFTYGAFRMRDLANAIFESLPDQDVFVRILDEDDVGNGDTPLVERAFGSARPSSSDPTLPTHVVQIPVSGRTWHVVCTASPELVARLHTDRPAAVALGGSIASVFLFIVVHLLASSRARIKQQVVEKTAALRESESRNRAILDTAIEAIIVINERGIIESANAMASRMFGWTNEEMVGQNVRMLMPNPDRDAHDGYIRRFTETGEARIIGHSREVMALRKNGATFPAQLGVSEVRAGAGARLFTGLLRDLTLERQQRDQIAEISSRLQAVLDAATEVSIIATDLSGRITVFNSGAEKLLGYSAEEMVNKQSPAIIHDPVEVEERSRELSAETGRLVAGFDVFVERALRGGVDIREWTYIRKDGARRTVSLAVTGVRVNDVLTGFLGISMDITERKERERELARARDAAETASRAKSDFVSIVSHELRTPLTSILGSLKLLEQGVVGELPVDAQELVTIASTDTERLQRLINQVLDLQKMESGRLDIALETVDLEPVLRRSLTAIEPYATNHGVSLMFAIEEARVIASRDAVAQVLTNLVSNAIKFSPKGATVDISAQIVRGTGLEGDRARIAIHDHGPGIPEEFQARIFGRFEQAGDSNRRKQGGTGLGLAISRGLVAQMNGQIGFETSPETGTTFWFTLPVA